MGRVLRRLFRPSLGRWGEWVALQYLRRSGWDIVARNWRGRKGEVDLIAYDGLVLVFVEVKTRRTPGALLPENQIGKSKEAILETLAFEFTLRHELLDCPVRVDVIAIETSDMVEYELRHYLAW